MQLLLLHPEVAFRSCEDCKKYVYNHESGIKEEHPPGSGIPILRLPGMLPPCSTGPKACAKVSPEAGHELNERNKLAYLHYMECRAVGDFPDDPLVRYHAAIIRSVEDDAEKMERRLHHSLIEGLIMRVATNG